MTHAVTVAPSAAVIVDADGNVAQLSRPRAATYRAKCSCRWRGPERPTQAQADVDGRAHVRLYAEPDFGLPGMLGEPEPLI